MSVLSSLFILYMYKKKTDIEVLFYFAVYQSSSRKKTRKSTDNLQMHSYISDIPDKTVVIDI